MTMGLAGPAFLFFIIIYFKRLITFRHFVVIFCLTLLLLSAYWYLPMRSATSNTEIMSSLLWGDQTRFPDFKRHLTGSTFHGLMFTQTIRQVLNNLKNFLNILNWEFTPPFTLLMIIGFFSLLFKRWKLSIFTFIIFFTDMFFSINYKIEDINVFYLPAFLMALIWISAGLKFLITRMKPVYAVIPILVILSFLISYFPNNLHKNFISYDYGKAISSLSKVKGRI